MTTENQAPEGGPTLSSERALREGHQAAAADEYFKARDWMQDTAANRNRFEAGFGLGWGARAALAAQPQSTRPADLSKSASAIDTSPAEGDERTAFEAWCKTEKLNVHRVSEEGNYANSGTWMAWHAWQARARARVQPKGVEPHGWVVWWPTPGGGHSPKYSHGPERRSFGEELDALLRHYPVYDAPQASAPSSAPAHEPAAWVPYLSDRADGVAGHYAIARHHPSGYREVWNLRKHCWGSFSDDVLTLEQANALMRQLVIPTAPAARPVPCAAVGAPIIEDAATVLERRDEFGHSHKGDAAALREWAGSAPLQRLHDLITDGDAPHWPNLPQTDLASRWYVTLCEAIEREFNAGSHVPVQGGQP